jgi:hypothetical protein
MHSDPDAHALLWCGLSPKWLWPRPVWLHCNTVQYLCAATLAAAALLGGGVVAKRSSGGSGHGSYNAGSGSGAASRPLDDFLDVMELLNGVAEEPVGEVLEDSFGVLLKRG